MPKAKPQFQEEQSLIIMKPDALQRNLLGEITGRFEKKGFKIIGLKMMNLSDVILEEHYAHHVDKPFFKSLKSYMKRSPVIVMAISGINAVKAARLLVGPTYGAEADAGSIRGDLCMSKQTNLVHASDSPETAKKEIKRFFKKEELFDYVKIDFHFIYGEEEAPLK